MEEVFEAQSPRVLVTEYLDKGQTQHGEIWCVILRNVIPPRGKWVQKPSKQ